MTVQRATRTPWGDTTAITERDYARQMTTPLDQSWCANIMHIWDDSSPTTCDAAANWFTHTAEMLATLSLDTGYTEQQAAGVIAALSPRARWNVNLRWAAQSLATGQAAGNMTHNRRKAQAIMDGVYPLDVLGVLKVGAFFCNLMGWDSRATIDVWVSRELTGDHAVTVTAHNYFYLERHVVEAARHLGVPTRHLVALLWIAGRGRVD